MIINAYWRWSQMNKWYENKFVEISFDIIPSIGIRYILPNLTSDKKKSIKKYPFINRKRLKIQ